MLKQAGFVPVVCVGRLCLDKQPAIYGVHQYFPAQNVPKPATTEIQCGGGEKARFCSTFSSSSFHTPAGLDWLGFSVEGTFLMPYLECSLLRVNVMIKSARLPLIH